MRLPVTVLVLAFLLAGCSDDPGVADTQADAGSLGAPDLTAPAPDNATQLPPVPMSLPVDFDGNLGTLVHGCVFPAGQCPTHVVVADETDVLVEHPGANFTGLDLNLTWTSTTPATQTLTLGFMVMVEGCEHACSTLFEPVTGTSPLRATLSGQSVPLNESASVHIYVYNPSSFNMLPGGAGYTLVSVDEEFHLEGTVRVLMPAT